MFLHRWEDEVTSTPTRPVDNVVIATKSLQDRSTNIIAGTKLTILYIGTCLLHNIFLFYFEKKKINERFDIYREISVSPEH